MTEYENLQQSRVITPSDARSLSSSDVSPETNRTKDLTGLLTASGTQFSQVF